MDDQELRVEPEDWPETIADTDGYQIVVAGPGTGKTEYLVRRVAHLINSGLAKRNEIAVLCFSRRAAADLGTRIEEAIGVTGVPIDVTTFHSLALRLIETAADGERPIPLTTPEQVGVVAELLREEDPEDWPLTYRGILDTPPFAAEVADFLLRCSERLLKPEDLTARAAERPDWRGLPGLFVRYLDSLSRSGRTDYGALLVSAVELLRSERGEQLADHYRYVLVDEYQDTSPVQAEMARLLARAHDNLTVAGDPYQSIYSFRGAELRNIADFTVGHPGAKRLVLTSSFRVPTEILSAALRVVSSGHLPGAAGPVTPAPHHGRCETYVFDQETAEAEWIAREVEHTIRVEDVPASSIAVLVRSKKELLNELSRALARRRIPHDPPESRLVDHPAVRLFADITTVATGGDDDGTDVADADRAMRRILLGPLFALGLGAERALLRKRRSSGRTWSEILDDELGGADGLADLVRSDGWLRDRPAAQGFWHAWTHLEGVSHIVADPGRDEWRRAWTSFAQVLVRQAERDPGLDLARFFELTEDEDFEATPLLTHRPDQSRVTLTTLHQAKGLEFDVVFVANAVEGVFPDLRRSRRMLRPELLSPERTTDAHAQHQFQVQEEMRLAYTAMTRARLRVVWTATDAGVDQGEHRPSRFLVAASAADSLARIGPPPEISREPVTLAEAETSLRRALSDPGDSTERRLAALRILAERTEWWDAATFPGVVIAGPDTPILDEGFRLSPSQADAYARCPRQYALERRLRLGDSDSPYAQFGTLVHAALEAAEADVVGTGEQHATLERALNSIDEAWEDAQFGTEALNRAWKAKAIEAVTKLYENWPNPNGLPVALEAWVEGEIAGVPWVGKIDRVEEAGGVLRVVDYKTSTRAQPREDAAESVQLAFYALAAATEFDAPVADAQFWYPRTSTKSITTRSLDTGRLDEIKEKMRDITTSIRDEDWRPMAGDHCTRCAFRLSCPAWAEGRGAFLP